MANINDNIRGKKLFKEGSSKQQAVKGSDGEYTVSKEISDDLTSLTDISDLFNDDAIYQTNKFLLKQVEDLNRFKFFASSANQLSYLPLAPQEK